MYRGIKEYKSLSHGPVSVSLLGLYVILLLSCLVKLEPVCLWYNVKGSITPVRVSVALYLTDGVVCNSNTQHFIWSCNIYNPRTLLCTLQINCCKPYEVTLVQTIVSKVINKCFVTDSAPVTYLTQSAGQEESNIQERLNLIYSLFSLFLCCS